MNSPPDFDYDSIPLGYYDEVFQRKKGMQSKWHHLKFERVKAEIGAGAVHLDVACGPGTFVSTLPPSIDSTGVDIAEQQIVYAKQHHAAPGKKFLTMSPARLPFDDMTFDTITSVELIEHITEAEAAALLQECKRVLKPGGKIILTTPNYASFWPVLEWILNRVGRVSYEDQHITKYTRSRMRKLLSAAGFESIDARVFLFSAPFHAVLSWKLADFVARTEPGCITRIFGNLLIGVAKKS